MKNHFILLTTALLIMLYKISYSQQEPNYINHQIDLLRNEDVLFNNNMNNPVLLKDSNSLNINLLMNTQWVGFDGAPIENVLSLETFSIKKGLSLGLYGYNKKFGPSQIRSVTTQINKRIWNNNYSKINLGLNLGIWQQQKVTSIFGNEIKYYWLTIPMIDLGFSYLFKNHFLSLAYNNFGKSRIVTNDSNYFLKQNGLVFNYRTDYLISNNFTFKPEFYGSIQSSSVDAIIVGKLCFKDYLSSGFLYNLNKSYGVLISGMIFKKLKIGYIYVFTPNNPTQKNVVGSHGINLRLILK